MKKLLLNVTCLNVHFDDAPNHVVATIDDEQIERIKALSNQVKLLDAYSIDIIDFTGEYCSTMSIESLIEDGEITVDEIDDRMVEVLSDDSGRMETQSIVVFKEGFKFTCVPKHCNESETCYSDLVTISELSNSNTYSSIEL